MSAAASRSWAATRFDGRMAAGVTVIARFEYGSLVIIARHRAERFALREIGVAEMFEHAPRMLALPGGVTLEVPDPARTLRSALLEAGVRETWVVRMQRASLAVAAGVVAIVALAVWGYVQGVPVAAQASHALRIEARRDNLLKVLDEGRLKPSALPEADRERIARRFAGMAARTAPGLEVRLEFRSGMVNAFALPGGTIVLFDEMVELADSDERVLGVLGHELGHVAGRHSTRQLLQALGVGAIAGLVWGDFSALAANATLVLGVMRYGRQFEDEADRYSLAFMRHNGLSARPLWEMFYRVEEMQEQKRRGVPAFLSTHPGTPERLAWLWDEMEADGSIDDGDDPER